MIFLRKLHHYVGFTLVPLILIQALTGLLLRLRISSSLLHAVHTWFKYRLDFAAFVRVIGLVVGVVVAVGLVILAVSGATLYLNVRVQSAKRARWRGQATG